jgi:hypothetical protein
VRLHRAHAPLVCVRVQPESARRTPRLQEPVPALPGAQAIGAHTDAPAQLADPDAGLVEI